MPVKAMLGWAGLAAACALLLWLWTLRPDADSSAAPAQTLQAEADCDSARQRCRAQGEDLAIELRLGPGLRPLETFAIELRSASGGLAAQARVEIRFQMRGMDMGLNRYRLEPSADGVWRGQAVLPVCTTGRSDWLAAVEIVQQGRRWVAELPFAVELP